jgi:exosome complex RNA-binding protein Rrp42 (RNase PH superfamily)
MISEEKVFSFRSIGAEAFHFLKPCDSIAERTFPVFVDLPVILDTGSIYSGLRLACYADPEV